VVICPVPRRRQHADCQFCSQVAIQLQSWLFSDSERPPFLPSFGFSVRTIALFVHPRRERAVSSASSSLFPSWLVQHDGVNSPIRPLSLPDSWRHFPLVLAHALSPTLHEDRNRPFASGSVECAIDIDVCIVVEPVLSRGRWKR
jgi:hypothetical protein